MGSQVTTLRLTAKCSPGQHRRLDQILGWSAEMYNALLESWKGTYAWWREHNTGVDEKFPRERNHSRYDLFKMFTQGESRRPPMGRFAHQRGAGCDLPFRPCPQSVLRAMRQGGNQTRLSPFQVPSPLAKHRNTGRFAVDGT